MARVRKTRAARRDYSDIWNYIARDNPDAADRVVRSFDERLELLARLPGVGRARDELMPGVRSFAVGSYVLFYREANGGIELLRVLHGARDIPAAFHGRPPRAAGDGDEAQA